VCRFIDRVAERARSRAVHLTAGSGHADRTCDGIAERVRRLHDHRIEMISLQTPEYLFQLATTQLLAKVRDALAR